MQQSTYTQMTETQLVQMRNDFKKICKQNRHENVSGNAEVIKETDVSERNCANLALQS